MIQLRALKKKDVEPMLEWMHDPDNQKHFQKRMNEMTREDVVAFCKKAKIPQKLCGGENLHFAIVDESDEYLGTISLKDISLVNRTAEYAISIRRKAQGQGIAKISTSLILQKAFDEYDLHRVYLNVLADNVRAIHLYEKCGFVFEGKFRDHLMINGKYVDLKWYAILKEEFNRQRL